MFQTRINIKYGHFGLFDFLNQKSKTQKSQHLKNLSNPIQTQTNESKLVRKVKNMNNYEKFVLVDLRKSQLKSTKLKSQTLNLEKSKFSKVIKNEIQGWIYGKGIKIYQE